MVEERNVGDCLPKYYMLLQCRITVIATVVRMPNFTRIDVVENVLKMYLKYT